VSCCLPNNGQSSWNHQAKEKALQDYCNVLQVVSVNIYARDGADHAARRDEAHPVPLPSPPDDPEPLVLPYEQLSMLLQVHQREHYADCKQRTKRYPYCASVTYSVDGHVARCAIDPRAVRQEGRPELVEDDVAFRLVRQRPVPGIVRVVPVVQRSRVKMDAIDDGVRVIAAIAWWKRLRIHQVAEVEQRHGESRGSLSVAAGRKRSQIDGL
jgi:hypothetical protein